MENPSGPNNKREDLGWRHCKLQDGSNTTKLTCIYCTKVISQGIERLKQHLVGGFKDVKMCPLAPEHVREEIKQYMLDKEKSNQYRGRGSIGSNQVDFDYNDDMGMGEEELDFGRGQGFQSGSGSGTGATSRPGTLDAFVSRPTAQGKSKGKLVQTTIDEKIKKEQREAACRALAKYFYASATAFNCAKLDESKEMIRLVGLVGPNMKPPSYLELRVPLLKKETSDINEYIEMHKKQWAQIGCSIMSHGWTNRRDRSLINFLVNSPLGTVFLESIDSSSYSKTGDKVFDLLDAMVEKVGEANVIQVVTDNASNYKETLDGEKGASVLDSMCSSLHRFDA